MTFQATTGNINSYVDASKGLVIYEYFENEWISCKKKWAEYITRKLSHLGCTSTQRAESSHHALNKGVTFYLWKAPLGTLMNSSKISKENIANWTFYCMKK
ncbi:uncharacterized protein RHIMIDRAFT_276140 [Rhizopus microsporus ATCC 52813]|uniref:Uncharacterized protein n=1 Tax=Rhizopus microsporus ATCC 52813 TaxID=1340429 RepID=A0A2G4T176_RHIZD|nr:uncharacterized protein RHIMIDRAFT_276140 [Rhizopus microsporus ATCC 52813]PHZ14757.1 hypothetical protein RHIMIDRAFT_276140 [Rhizopus microsporus ATCC 52813]